MVVRDPYDRAESMFLYWKYGGRATSKQGSSYARDESFLQTWGNVTFQTYLEMVEQESPALVSRHIWKMHYTPTSHWLRPAEYPKAIVVEYYKDMNYCLQELFEYTGIKERASGFPKQIQQFAGRALCGRMPLDSWCGDSLQRTSGYRRICENIRRSSLR